MAYDLHGVWDNKTGHHAALYAPKGSSPGDRFLTVVRYSRWIANGILLSEVSVHINIQYHVVVSVVSVHINIQCHLLNLGRNV